MDSSTHVSIVFTICLPLFFHSLSPTTFTTAAAITDTDTTPSKLVELVCSHESSRSDQYPFCVQVLGSDPKAKTATNLVDMAKIILELAASNATVTQDYIRNLIKSLQPSQNETLELCLNAYNDGVITEFQDAIRKVEEKAYPLANYACKIAGEEGRRCELAVASAGIQDLSINEGNKFVHNFYLLGLTVTDLLH